MIGQLLNWISEHIAFVVGIGFFVMLFLAKGPTGNYNNPSRDGGNKQNNSSNSRGVVSAVKNAVSNNNNSSNNNNNSGGSGLL